MVTRAGAAYADASAASVRFGAAGWRMIVVSMFLYFAYAGWCVDGINIFSTALAKDHGWDEGTLLALVAPGGLMGVVGSAVWGQWILTRGPRWVMTVTLACTAAVVLWFGRIGTLWEFTVVFMLINFFGAGFGFIAPGTLLTHWFPRRKGMALAIATCGYPLATAAFVPLIAWMFGSLGIAFASTAWAFILLGASFVTWLVIRDAPAHVEGEAHGASDFTAYRSPFTLRTLLRDRDQWFISVGWGCLWMVTVGIVVQLVPRLMEIGYDQSEAIGMLSAAAVCALPGSMLWGYLDQRFGTRMASVVYALLYIATLVLLMGGSRQPAVVFTTVVMVGLGLGGIKSLITSMTASVYGPYDFSAAYRVIIPVAIVVRTLCFPIMGLALSHFGTRAAAYAGFILVDILALILIINARCDCKGRTADEKQTTHPD